VTFTLSPPVRYAALLGLLLAVLGSAGMMLMGRGGGGGAEAAHTINPHPFGTHAKKQTSVVPKKRSTAKAANPKTTITPLATPTQKAPQQAPAVQAALAAGLPAPIANALGKHPIVVVSLFNPYSEVDGIAFAEARAGAKLAGVGFVPLNVLSQSQAGKLTETLGLLPDPGVFVYTRPGTLVARISGFADKETVAQAAQNAAAHGT
jgi:hypothetical protein